VKFHPEAARGDIFHSTASAGMFSLAVPLILDGTSAVNQAGSLNQLKKGVVCH
jgi:hypothetical protein